MTRAKKVILALICAAALCCAAIGGVLLARQPAHAAAGDVTALEIVIPDNTRFYVFEDLADAKGKITVNAEIEGGSSRQLDASEYELSVQGRGDMTEDNGVTFGGASIREYILVATYTAEDVAQVSGQRTIEVRPDEYVQIKAEYTGSAIYPYTNVESTQFKRDVEAYILMASQVASEPQGQGARLQATDYVLSAEDLSAPATKVEGGTYTREVTLTYTGEGLDEIYEDTVTFEVPVKPVKVVSIEALGTPEAAIGDTFDVKTMIEDQGITFYVGYNESNLFGNAEVEWDETKFTNIRYTTYDPDSEAADENGYVIDATKTTFSWVSETNGLERIYFTYTENAVSVDGFIDVQVRRTPYTESPITTDREYGYGDRDNIAPLTYLMTVDEESGEVTGKAWEISIGNSQYPFRSEIVEISVRKDGKDISEDVVANIEGQQSGKINLTDVGTYTIRLTLISDMYYWSTHADDQEDRDIEYTVTIVPAELVGTEFTFGGGWTYGEEANLPAEIKLVSRVGEDTTVSFAPPAGATIKVTFTGTPNGGAQQTYSYTYTQGSQPSPGTNVPSLAGSYKVYVEVTGMANYADVTFANSGTNKDFKQEDFTIARQGVELPELTQEHYTYTGETIGAEYSAPDECSVVTAGSTTSAVNVQEGGYTIVFALKDSNNYCWGTDGSDDLADKTLTWHIVKADNKITGVDALGWTYGGAVNTPQITGSTFAENTHGLGDWSAATITYRYNDAAFPVPADTLGWNVGEYTYTITYEGNDNINAAMYTGTFTVEKGQAVIDGTPTIDGWTYGGTANTPSGVTGVTVSGTAITPRPGYYAYYGETNGGVSYGSNTEPVKDVPTDAGTYYVVYVVEDEDTDNYTGATGAAAEFTISRKQIAKPAYESAAGVSGNAYTSTYNAAQQSIDITGVDAVLSIGGANASIASRTDTTVTLSAKNVEVSGGNAAAYEVTFSFTDKNNYCWSGTEDDVADVAFTWTIKKAENPITASDTYAGWSYGSTPADVSALEAKAKYDNLTIDHAYYAADDFDETSGKPNSGAAEIEISATTPAGRYVLYLYHEGNDNTLAADQYFAFTVSQATATILAAFADGDTLAWTYRDADSAHVLEVTVTVGDTTWQYWYRGETLQNKTEGSPEALVVQYLDESGNDVTSAVTSDGMYQLPVGGYSVKVSLNTSAMGVSGNFTASEQTVEGISVSPFVVDIPTFTRENVFVEDTAWHPTVANSGERGAAWDIVYNEGNDSISRGSYWLTLTLQDSTNFVWDAEDLDVYGEGTAAELRDSLTGTNNETAKLFYRITGAIYGDINFDIEDWTYGDAAKDPTYNALPADKAAEAVITYYKDSISDENRLNAKPTDAGSYIVTIFVPAGNYEQITGSAAFTIGQRELTDVQWSGLTGSYTGSARAASVTGVTGLATENGFSDTLQSLGLQFTYSGAAFDGTAYGENSAAPVNAGNYTVTAVLNNANYCFAKGGDTVSAEYIVSKVMLTVKADDAKVTYGGDAPVYTVTITGFVNGEGEGVLDELPAATSAYTKQTGVGSVTITVSGGSDNNYAFPVYSEEHYGILTVKAAGLQGVKIDNLTGENALTYKGAAYDIKSETGAAATAVNPAQNVVTWYFSESEIASQPTNETQGIITSLTDAKRNADNTVGTYTIYYYVSAPNHAAQRGSVQIAITPAALTLTANNISVVYGEEIAESAYGYTVSGLVGNDRSNQAELFAKYTAEYSVQVNGKEYAAGVDAGPYSGAVTLTNTADLIELLPNYSVQAPVAGGLTVTGRAIRVEIGSVPNANYGAVLNATDLSVTGIQATNGTGDGVIAGDLVQGETTGYAKYANVFTLVVKNAEGVEQTLGTALSVGVYTIEGVADGSRTANYTITFVSGSYSVGQSTLQVVVTGASSAVYDGAAHGYTVSVSGVNGASVNYTVKYTDSDGEDIEGQPVDAGTYTLHIETDDSNYAPYVYQTEFTITPRPVAVVWDVPTLVYNGDDQLSAVTAKYFVWENGSLSTTKSVELSVALQGGGSMIDAGAYTAEAAFKTQDGNYTLTGAANPTTSVTVSPRPIVVTIENKTSEYGDDLQTLTATEALGTVTGWTDDGKGAIVPGDAKPYNLYIQDYTGGHLAVGSHNIFGSDTEEGDAIDANYDVTFRGTGSANHGVYTVNSRAVTIEFAQDEYTATYGTQFDFAAAANAVTFARGTAETSGSAFASGESFASVLGETQFAVIADGYGVASAAGSAFAMQMTLGSTTAGTLSVGNYTFTFTDTAELTVQQRAITVAIGNIPGAGEDELLYGTGAVADAYAKLYDYVSVTPGAGVSGSALVNGDTEESVFSLTVYGTDVVVPDDKTPAGTYYIVGMPIGGNYDITFTGSTVYDGKSAGTFIISVNGDATSGISVFTDDAKQAVFTYDGEEHYLLLTGAGYGAYGRLGELAMADGLNLRAAVNNVEWNVTQNNPFLWQFSFTDSTTTGSDGMPQFTSSVASIKDVTTQNGGVYTVYYIVYMPDNLNYAAATGSFTVKVEQATNEWANEDEYGHEGWAYNEQEADASETNPLFDGLETGSQFTAPQAVFGTAYNQADGTVSGVTFTYYSDDTYAESARIADPDTFFTYNTPAGTYYVKVEVAGTDNYTGLTGYYELVVSKHILSVRWNPENLTVDDGLSGTSVLGYNDRFMTYVAADLTVTASGTSFTAEKPANTGRYGATFIIKDELLANYEWANADGNDAANCTIYFTVSEAENVVTVTITTDVGGTEGWTYGDSVTFAAYQLGSAGQNGTIVVTATSMQSVSYAYARDVAGVTDGSDSRLVYNISALPTDAGTYWVRAYVTGDIDEGYGNKAGYAKFTVAKYQVAVPTAGALLGGDGGVYDGSVHTYLPTLDGFTWDTNNYGMAVLTLDNGEQVILRVSGNRAIDAGGHTAKVSPVDPDNYVWDDGSAAEKELEWSIEKQTLARPFIGEDGKYSLTTTYSPSTTMKELIDFNAEVMGFAGAAYGSSYYYANDTSYLSAGNAGEYWISISLKYPQNYQWATGDGYNGEDADAYTRLTWTIAKAEFDIHNYIDDIQFAVGEYVYNGQVQYPRLEDAGNLPSGVRLVGYEVTAGNGTDAGEHTVTAIFALTGSHADNYTFAAGGDALTQEYTIAKAVISDVTWTVQRHYTYNGEDQFDVVKAYYGLGGGIHELQVGVQTFKDYKEGGYTFTVAGFKTDDENAKNYTLSGTFSETFYIDKLSVYIVVGEAAGSHIYDGLRPTLTEYGFGKVAVYGIDGDDLRDDFIEVHDKADWEANMRFALLDADGNEPSAWNVGSYTVTVTGAEFLQNYAVTRIQTGTLEIVPKEITITGFDSPGAAFGDDVFESAAVTAVDGLVNGETIGELNFLYTYTGTADDGWTADGTLTSEMHAGSYTVNVSLQGGNYVLTGNVSYSYKVSPMLVDPDLVEIDDLPYTGQAQTLTKEDTRFTGTGSAYDLFDYSVAAESGTEVGGYRVTLIIGNANYLWQSGAAGYGNMTTDRTWRIVEALAEDISVSLPQVSITHWGETAASVTAGGSVAAIDGTEISVNITYLFEVKDESGNWVKFTGSVWNAGDYRVRAEAASDNFPAAYSEYHEFTVQPGVYDVSGLAFADMTLTYDGQAHGLVLTVNGSAAAGGSIGGGALGATGTVAYTLGGAETDAGTYTMTATLTAGANYTFAGGETAYELTGTLVIEPYTVTIQWAAGDFTYDKQDHSGDVWAYFIGAGNSHIDLDLVLEGADEMVDAGEYTFTVAGASDQSGAAVDLANYMLAGGDIAGAQKEYTVRKFAAAVNWGQTSFTYNGKDQIDSVQPSFVGVGGEEIALSVQPQALRDFGTYTVAVVIGEELKNYELSNTEAQISIAKLPVTVTADDISAALGAAEQTLTYTLAPSEAAGVFAADEAAGRVEVSLSRVPGTAAGAYDIYISVTGEGAENYALTLVGGTYTIRERAIELSIELPADLVYSGAPKAAVLIAKEVGGGEIAVPAGITLWYEGKDNAGNAYASAQAPVNAGSYTVGVRIDTQDYDVSNANITVEMTIGRAAAFIDVSGVQTQYTYTGALQRVEGGAALSHGESALVYSNNTFTSVSEGDGKVVSVDAAMSCNYKAAHAEVTISVAKAAISPAVSIHGWTYGQSANGYTVTGNPGGGAIEAVYGGTTNAGAAYSGGQAPTEAGSYTLTVTVAETENYLGGSASTSFTVARAALHVSVSIEGWAFGESPNGYTVSPASMRDTITSVRYAGEGYSGSQPPTQVGSYTLTVTFAQTANYQGGSASDSFSITQGTLAPGSVSLTIEGWTYGEAPNRPVLTGAPAGAEVSYRYSGTANDGTAWNSDTAPSKAGSYKVTAHISAAGYASFEAEASFTVARRLVAAPTLGDTGGRTASSVYDGEEVRIAVTGYDGALMDFTAEEGTQLVMEGQQLLLAADAEGTYVLQVSLKDIYNYGWADLAEGEQIAGDIALAWEVTLAMHSLLWLIILLFILLLILIVLLIVFAKKDHDARARIAAAQQGAESGADGRADERRNHALAPVGLLFAVPVWQISLIAALAVAAAVLLVADVVLLVLWRKDAAKAERAEEAAQEAAAAAQDENLQAENAQEAGGDENSASAE